MAAGFLLWAAGCAGKAPATVSPEAAAAIQGRQVIAAADAVLTGLDAALASGQLQPAVGLPVVKAIRQVGLQAQALADTLAILDQAKTALEAAQAKQSALAILATMQGLLNSAVNPITDPAAKTAVNDLLKNLVNTINAVQGLVGG